jgi:hypothetical protein
VNKADQAIVFGPVPPVTYGDPDFIITAASDSSLEVAFTSGNPAVAAITGGLVHIINAGTAIITASQPGDQNYNPATEVTRVLIVNKADQVITFPALAPVVYGTAAFNAGASSSSGLPITYRCEDNSVAEVTDGTINIKGAGNTGIIAGQPGNNNFNPAEEKQIILTVTKAPLTITAEDKTKTYLSANPPLNFNYSGFAYGENISVLDDPPEISTDAALESPAGEYMIRVSGGADDC